MDPNRTLREIRELVANLQEGYDSDDDESAHEVAEVGIELANKVDDLLEWLRRDGFAPDWSGLSEGR